jgi:hypothetical protein
MLEVASAILPDVIAEEDIRSLPSSLDLPATDPALRHPNSWKGQRFGGYGETDDRHRPVDLGPGLWLGTRDASARLIGSYRPERPRTAANGHVVKYEGPRGARPAFAVPKRCREALLGSKCDIIIPEGYKKALAVASAGGCAIAVAGVDAWSVKPEPDAPGEPIPDFGAIPWHGRTVWLAWDSDIREKDGVQRSEKRLTKELESRGAIVIPLRIPHRPDGSKRGIDDYTSDRLAAGIPREDALAELKSVALAELVRLSRVKREPATGTDGGETCQSCAAMAERSATHRAEASLLTDGPVSVQEAAFYRHVVKAAALERAKGSDRVRLYLPKDAPRANVSRSTATRALNKLRTADQSTLPILVDDAWRGGKQHVDVIIPTMIGSEPWSERAALVGLCRATFAEPRPKQGGSQAASAARWGCRHHPDGAVIETTTTHFRCGVDDCGESYSPPATVVRHPGTDDPIQVEPGAPVDVVALFGASFATTVIGDPIQVEPGADDLHDDVQVEASSLNGETLQLEPCPLIPVTFTSAEDQLAAKRPHSWGDAPPEEPEPCGRPPRPAWAKDWVTGVRL